MNEHGVELLMNDYNDMIRKDERAFLEKHPKLYASIIVFIFSGIGFIGYMVSTIQ